MASRNSADIGKSFEQELTAVFKRLKTTYAFDWHPLADTRAAGNTIASQPSDYLIAVPGTLLLLEAKSSAKLSHFIPSMLRPKQRQTIQHWHNILGVPYFVVFKDMVMETVSILEGGNAIDNHKNLLCFGPSVDLDAFLVKALDLRRIDTYIHTKRGKHENRYFF